jgi:hypothetical protein
MRSIEFLREYSPEAGPMTDAEYAAQQAQGQKNLAALKGVGQKIAGAFQGNNQAAAPIVPLVNPYQGADAAKFAAMTPADQAFYTQGGGNPDINDPYIAMRAPNKVKPPAPNLGAGALASTSSAEQSSAAPAASPSLGAGALASTSSAEQSSAAAPAAAERSPEQDMGAGAAAPERSPEQDMGAGAAAAPEDNPEQQFGAGAAAPAATPAAATPTSTAANKAMTPAITAYASRMGLLTNNKPNVDAIKKFQTANGLTADGIIGGKTAGAILSAQKPGGNAANLRGPAAPGQAATPAPKVKPPRYKTPQEYDREITRFSKTSDPKLPPNARYIATLQAEKAALAGQGAAPAGQAATPTTSGGRPVAAPAARTFEESVDMMRRLSTMLKG